MEPQNEAELSEALAGAEGPVSVRGGGTRGVVADGEALRFGGAGISLYEPGALTLVAQAGTPVAEIEAALEAEGQRLAFEVPDMRGLLSTEGESTIGGVVASNASGPRRVSVGAARDFCLGVRFVDGVGRVVQNGGRVMKNVTGYDLVKLVAGSHGTLGVLTEVSLKVLPKPEVAGVLSIDGLSVEDAVAAMSAALGTPWEVTAACHTDLAANDRPSTQLRIEGMAGSVDYRLGRLKEALGRYGEVETAVSDSHDWPWFRDVARFAGGAEDVWRLHCRPSDAPGLVARLPEGAKVMLDWGGALVWAAVPAGTDLRAALGAFDGHATRVRGQGGGIARFHPERPELAALTAGLRARFDPRGILNRGLMA
ncbi:FAD-binding protein [Vannielia litorea]|uniref:FAD-binding protein n=1 Tax=Vannielia litorea TaxID=1217970 RepID=UPI001C97B837|nr:FAD-binding protein [Vannielia litorea]MBY6046121.1 FAD-binding protein [Vannielia litorea]MBY6073534.1 FAD-binding protein [Vannielia litorea]